MSPAPSPGRGRRGDAPEPMLEAERRIAAAASERAAELDLSGLGLAALPEAIGRLTQLQKRIKSLCGAKPPQKLRWTKAGRWSAIGAMEISPRTLGAWADNRGSAWTPCVVRPLYRGRERRLPDDRRHHLEQSRGSRLRCRQGISVACRCRQQQDLTMAAAAYAADHGAWPGAVSAA